MDVCDDLVGRRFVFISLLVECVLVVLMNVCDKFVGRSVFWLGL